MPSSGRFVVLAVVFETVLGLGGLGLGWFLKRPPLAQIDWTVAAAIYGLLATAPLVVGLHLMTCYPVGPLKSLTELVRQLVVPLFARAPLWHLAMFSALAGFGEEILFRGALQAGAQQLSGSPWLGLALASVLFGVAHMITPTYGLLACVIGAYLGGLWLVTDNLLVPIIVHAAYDFVALIYLRRDKKADTAPPTLSAEHSGA